MNRRRLRTADYTEDERARLGQAVAKAREAAGHDWRPSFAQVAGISVRALSALEQGEPGVGQRVVHAVGRALGQHWRDWDEDTPQLILEGGPIPPLVKEVQESPAGGPELRDEFERAVWAVTSVTEEEKWLVIDIHRARAQRRNEVDPPQTA